MTDHTGYSRRKLLTLTFLVEGAVLIAAVIIAMICSIKLFPLTQHIFRDMVIGTLCAVFPLVIFVFIVSGRAKDLTMFRSIRSTIINEIKTIFAETRLIDLFVISICAGLAEELLFRGVIQARLGIVVASIIFGLVHFITPVYCIIATIMGFYLGLLFWYFDSLLIPIQMHLIYDLGALIYLRYFVKA